MHFSVERIEVGAERGSSCQLVEVGGLLESSKKKKNSSLFTSVPAESKVAL